MENAIEKVIFQVQKEMLFKIKGIRGDTNQRVDDLRKRWRQEMPNMKKMESMKQIQQRSRRLKPSLKVYATD